VFIRVLRSCVGAYEKSLRDHHTRELPRACWVVMEGHPEVYPPSLTPSFPVFGTFKLLVLARMGLGI
jgi:hypothetical protein